NMLAALSSTYSMLLIARLITSLCHGAFFGVGSIVATSVVPETRRAGAVATMFMGLTIANVGGVPLASWVGEAAGWRTAFWGITGLGVLAMTALFFALPHMPQHLRADMRTELRVLRKPSVLSALGVTVLGSGAMFA